MASFERIVVNNENNGSNNGNGNNNSGSVVLASIIDWLKNFKTVVMHKAPHLDEIVAYYLLTVYGRINPCVRFVEQEIAGTEVDHDRNGILPIGCGINCRFNEHRKDIERIHGECATTLVAKHLGITELPEVKRLIEEVLFCDDRGHCSPTQLAELVKIANRCLAKNPQRIVDWTVVALRAIISNEQYHFTERTGDKSLIDHVKMVDAGGYFAEDKRVREYIFRTMQESEKRSGKSVTELSSIIQAMYQLPYSEKVISDWLDMPLAQICADQLEFQQQVDALKDQKGIDVTVLTDSGEGFTKCLIVQSDSLQAQKAARSLGARIILVRNSKGNVIVCIDNKFEWLNLSNVARMIRWLELPIDGKNVDWKSLGVPAKHDLVPQWYYYKKAEQLLNGSQTNAAPPTEIGTKGLVDVLKHAFHPKLVAIWCKQRGIERFSSPDCVEDLKEVLAVTA